MTPDEAAALMVEILNKKSYLDHEIASYELVKKDKSLIRYNDNGNMALTQRVLDAFRKAMPENVVWSRGERHWRFRKPYDKPGRMQD